ncbi:hypothetical protein DFP73DRAFT_559987 [Morchella snyderi]|nr:hypothetical protein DFP73DRAFT_559987 [Morchella snyderi]
MVLGVPPPPPLIAGIIPPLIGGLPPPAPAPPASMLPGPILAIALAAGQTSATVHLLNVPTRLMLLQACTTFEELLSVRTHCRELFEVYELHSSALLTLMTARYFSALSGTPSTAALVEAAKEILLYQRYMVQGELPREGQRALAALLHHRLVTEDRNNVWMRALDVRQLKENNYFYERFSDFYNSQLAHATYPAHDGDPRHWVKLQDERDLNFAAGPAVVHESAGLRLVEFEVDNALAMTDFYAAWLLTYRFKYESIAAFARRAEPLAPARLGKIHFIAFLMDQFYLSQIPFNRKSSGRTGPPNADPVAQSAAVKTAVLTGWRNRCFMGVWYPLKVAEEGFFSLDFSRGFWQKVLVDQRAVGWVYLRRNAWGIFTEVRGGGHLLYWKMLAHLAETVWRTATVAQREDRAWEDAFLDIKAEFDEDFSVLGTLALAAKYNLVDTN